MRAFFTFFSLLKGRNHNAKRPDRIRDTCRVSLTLAVLIACVGVLVFEAVPQILLSFFHAGEAMTQIGTPALRIIAPTFLLAAGTVVTVYLISGFGNGTVNMISTALRQLILLLPLVWIISRVSGLSHVWYSFWISEVAAALYAGLRLKKYLSASPADVDVPLTETTQIEMGKT